MFLRNPSVASAAGEHTQLWTEGLPDYLSREPVFFLELHMFLLISCVAFELGAECLPLRGLRLGGSGLKGRLVSLGFHSMLGPYDFMT